MKRDTTRMLISEQLGWEKSMREHLEEIDQEMLTLTEELDRLNPQLLIQKVRDSFKKQLGVDPFTRADYEALGIDTDGSALVFTETGATEPVVAVALEGTAPLLVEVQALVVSSDREVADFALAHGAAAISAPEFENRLALSAAATDGPPPDDPGQGWVPTTKKKGPRRRLSKRARRVRAKTRKL